MWFFNNVSTIIRRRNSTWRSPTSLRSQVDFIFTSIFSYQPRDVTLVLTDGVRNHDVSKLQHVTSQFNVWLPESDTQLLHWILIRFRIRFSINNLPKVQTQWTRFTPNFDDNFQWMSWYRKSVNQIPIGFWRPNVADHFGISRKFRFRYLVET